jgi:RNA polymerase sigma-70 factor (ECF subfamily)
MVNNDMQFFCEVQGGSIHAFEVLFRRYYAPLCSYAHRFTGDPDFSEELVQELYYILWRDRVSLHIDFSVKSYLYEAVRKRALRHLEHLRVRERYGKSVKIEMSEAVNYSSTEADVEVREVEKRMSEILFRFPDRRRKIFYMHRFGGSRYAEIAEKLSVSVKTVEAEMHKALKALKTGL